MAPALSLGAGLLVEKGGRWVGQEQPVLLAGVWLWDRRAEVWFCCLPTGCAQRTHGTVQKPSFTSVEIAVMTQEINSCLGYVFVFSVSARTPFWWVLHLLTVPSSDTKAPCLCA